MEVYLVNLKAFYIDKAVPQLDIQCRLLIQTDDNGPF